MKKSIVSFSRQKYFPPAAERFLSESWGRLILQQCEQELQRGGEETGLGADATISLWEMESMHHGHGHGKEEIDAGDVLEKMPSGPTK